MENTPDTASTTLAVVEGEATPTFVTATYSLLDFLRLIARDDSKIHDYLDSTGLKWRELLAAALEDKVYLMDLDFLGVKLHHREGYTKRVLSMVYMVMGEDNFVGLSEESPFDLLAGCAHMLPAVMFSNDDLPYSLRISVHYNALHRLAVSSRTGKLHEDNVARFKELLDSIYMRYSEHASLLETFSDQEQKRRGPGKDTSRH